MTTITPSADLDTTSLLSQLSQVAAPASADRSQASAPQSEQTPMGSLADFVNFRFQSSSRNPLLAAAGSSTTLSQSRISREIKQANAQKEQLLIEASDNDVKNAKQKVDLAKTGKSKEVLEQAVDIAQRAGR